MDSEDPELDLPTITSDQALEAGVEWAKEAAGPLFSSQTLVQFYTFVCNSGSGGGAQRCPATLHWSYLPPLLGLPLASHPKAYSQGGPTWNALSLGCAWLPPSLCSILCSIVAPQRGLLWPPSRKQQHLLPPPDPPYKLNFLCSTCDHQNYLQSISKT